MQHFLWESNAFWEILVKMAVIAVIAFQFPKKGFFMFYNVQTLCDTDFFSLHLINFKGVIGVPVAVAKILSETG